MPLGRDHAALDVALTFAIIQICDDLRSGALSAHRHAFQIFLQALNILNFGALVGGLSLLDRPGCLQRLHVLGVLVLVCLHLLKVFVDSGDRSGLPVA